MENQNTDGEIKALKPYQADFIRFALECGVLKFGSFKLKSGRTSPYFYNAGLFNQGEQLARLGEFYAAAILDQSPPCDLLFGPAYKGIPIAAATAIALAQHDGWNLSYAFNRKEVKTHGEGGSIVGAELTGRVLIIDDVITAGTAIREVMAIMSDSPAQPVAVVVALDREEKGKAEQSAIQEVEAEFGIPVLSIIKLSHLVTFLRNELENPVEKDVGTELVSVDHVKAISDYQAEFGVSK